MKDTTYDDCTTCGERTEHIQHDDAQVCSQCGTRSDLASTSD
jgi:DNA-directed RNA polymerase subunit RPC12/RpoP